MYIILLKFTHVTNYDKSKALLHAIICYCNVAEIQVSASQVLIRYCYDTYKQNPNKWVYVGVAVHVGK